MTRLAAAMLALLMLGGCFPTIESPPVRSDDMVIPAALCGPYIYPVEAEPETVVLLMIVPSGDCKSVLAHVYSFGPEGTSETDRYEGEAVVIGDALYLSLRGLGDREDSKWFIVRAFVTDSGLTLSFMHDERTLEAVRSGLIAGTITGPESDPSVHITASADALAAFLATDAGRTLFVEAGPEKTEGIITFRRITPADALPLR